MALQLVIENQKNYLFDQHLVEREISSVIDKFGLNLTSVVNLYLIDENKMKVLHKKHMVTDEATDVLSFPLEDLVGKKPYKLSFDGKLYLGDIVICYPVAVKQALTKGISINQEVAFLAEHGTCHLVGQHHETGF